MFDRIDGEFRRGIFFEMRVEPIWVSGRICEGSRIHYGHDCSLHRTCRTAVFWRPFRVELWRPPRDIIQCTTETQAVLAVSDHLLAALSATDLSGYRAEACNIIDADEHRWHQLIVTGRRCERAPSVHGCENKCPHCGDAPIVCPETAEVNFNCPVCRKGIIVFPHVELKPDDKRLPVKKTKRKSRARILDGCRWKGEDLLFGAFDEGHGHFVSARTRRLIEPFSGDVEFRDVDFDVTGMTGQQLDRLKQVTSR